MKFSETHEWIDVKGTTGTVGVSEFAQKELGDIVYVELPQLGKTVKKGDPIAVLESTKAAADVYTPVSGTIIEVNHQLKEAPELINQHAENSGWLFTLQLSNPEELNALQDEQAYRDGLRS